MLVLEVAGLVKVMVVLEGVFVVEVIVGGIDVVVVGGGDVVVVVVVTVGETDGDVTGGSTGRRGELVSNCRTIL